MRAPLALCVLLSLAACTSVEFGREFDARAFDARVKTGATTRADVQAWLGAPGGTGSAVEANGERLEQWTYFHGKGRLPRLADANLSVLQIKFDPAGVVRSYNWTAEQR